jgi:heme A synthase
VARLVCLGLSLAVVLAAVLSLVVVFSRGATDRAERRDCMLYAVARLDGVCPQGAIGTWRAR